MTLLGATTLDVTLILTLALAAARLLRRRSAALRHAVVAGALIAAALTPALEAFLPQVPIIRWSESAAAVSSGLTLSSRPAPETAAEIVTTGSGAPAVPWATLLFGGWLAGALLTLAGLATGLVRLARLTARCTPVRAGSWRGIADDLSRRYRLRRPVQLLQSGDPSLLVTCGVLRPKIILPAGAAGWSDDRRRVVLAHELAHVRRRDGTVQLIGEVVRALQWFNPLVWIACRRLRQESEYACDDAVLGDGVAPAEYATHLLGVARHAAARHHVWASAPAIAHPSTLERRISAMLTHQRNREPLTRRASALAAVAVLTVALPIAVAGVAPPVDPPAVAVTPAADVSLEAAAVAPSAATPVDGNSGPAARAVAQPAPRNTPAAAAQRPPATLAGVMQDPSAGVLPGVELTLTDTQFGVAYRAVSDGAGRFAFRELQPGRYELVANLRGFAAVRNIITIADAANLQRTITLPLGTLEETITVTCSATGGPSASLFRPEVATVAQVIAAAPGAMAVTRRPMGRLFLGRRPDERPAGPAVPAAQDQLGPGQPVRVGGQIRVPRQTGKVNPICPRTLLPSADLVVNLTARVGVDGFLNDVRHVPGDAAMQPPAEFIESALEAVRQWTYTQTLLNNQPVEVSISITVLYRRV